MTALAIWINKSLFDSGIINFDKPSNLSKLFEDGNYLLVGTSSTVGMENWISKSNIERKSGTSVDLKKKKKLRQYTQSNIYHLPFQYGLFVLHFFATFNVSM